MTTAAAMWREREREREKVIKNSIINHFFIIIFIFECKKWKKKNTKFIDRIIINVMAILTVYCTRLDWSITLYINNDDDDK